MFVRDGDRGVVCDGVCRHSLKEALADPAVASRIENTKVCNRCCVLCFCANSPLVCCWLLAYPSVNVVAKPSVCS